MMNRLQQLDADNVRRICIIKPSAFGDVVQTLPVLPVLKERFPNADVSWVIRRELTGLLEGHPQLDEIIPYDRHGSWLASLRLLRTLRRRRFDLTFDLQGLLRTAVMNWATRAKVRVGLQTAREGSSLACNVILPDSGRMVPAHVRYWQVAEALGLGDRQRISLVKTSLADDGWAARQLSELGRPCLAIHPGARWETKRWPVEHFAVVAAKAYRRFGFALAILGSHAERTVADSLEEMLRRIVPAARVLNLTGATSIKQLAALLKRQDVVLTNDSGPMHLAAAMNTPVMGIFTATDPVRSGPPGDRHELTTTSLPCRNCYKKRCPQSGEKQLACLQDVTVEQVWARLERMIRREWARERVA